jgi:alpha-L-fucosidase
LINFKMFIYGAISFIRWMGLSLLALVRGAHAGKPVPADRSWWQRPGLNIMYQIETRPGWKWDRDYVEFNKSLGDGKDGIAFNGPHCNIGECIELSREAGVDYHQFEIKWHDGICFFDTKTTQWKADRDYAGEFAELSRAAGFPFMFYYSAVFDHNPRFDSIQPKPRSTPSLIGENPIYLEYLKKHYAEIIPRYRPDGMWIDWWWADGSTKLTVKEFREKYPQVVMAFNLSNLHPASFNKIHITSCEAHRYDGAWVALREEDTVKVPVFTSAKKWANALRWIVGHQWELISPAGKWWQDQSLRDDPLELIRSMAMVLACGGKFCVGATFQMDGYIFPDQVRQLRMLGEWYRPRKQYFIHATPVRYRWFDAPGVSVSTGKFDTVASAYDSGLLLHLLNPAGARKDITVTLKGAMWKGVRGASIVPGNEALEIERDGSTLRLHIAADRVDPVDTIIHLSK